MTTLLRASPAFRPWAFLAPLLGVVPPRAAMPALARGRTQWLPVSAFIRERYLVTYRAPAERLAALVPAPLAIDAWRGQGFISVCALDIEDMGIVGLPSWLRFDNRELLYRVGVRAGGQPSFFTLRSDVSAPALALLGRFSHYRSRLGDVARARADGRLRLVCRSRDGRADCDFEAAPEASARPRGSLFADAAEAARFMLGMSFSVDVAASGRVRTQAIDHDPWGACFAEPVRRRFDFIDGLGRAIGARLEYDHTLAMTNLRQTWRAARWT